MKTLEQTILPEYEKLYRQQTKEFKKERKKTEPTRRFCVPVWLTVVEALLLGVIGILFLWNSQLAMDTKGVLTIFFGYDFRSIWSYLGYRSSF